MCMYYFYSFRNLVKKGKKYKLEVQMVKNLLTVFDTQVGKILLEKEMATHSSILARRIPWTEEPLGYSPWGRKELD